MSVSSAGKQADEASYARGISADGRFVVFSSFASNLVAGDTHNCDFAGRRSCSDVFVRDRERHTTTRASLGRGGKQANGDSGEAAISADGRFIAFSSFASNLVVGDTNRCVREWRGRYPCPDVFVLDRRTGKTERVSVSSAGKQASGDSSGGGQGRTLAISAHGRFVAFSSDASNLVPGDTNKAFDVFVRDRVAGKTTRVSVGRRGEQGNGGSSGPSISAGGRLVAFVSEASNLVAGDTKACFGMNCPDVLVRDTVAAKTQRVSVAGGSRLGNGSSFDAAISADGRFVAFSSYASNLVAGDTTCPALRRRKRFACLDLFLRDRATGKTELIGVSGGRPPNGHSREPSLNANGRFVAFVSAASNLVAGDTNGVQDVFVRDRKTGKTTLISTGR